MNPRRLGPPLLGLVLVALVLALLSRADLVPSPRTVFEHHGELTVTVLDVGQGDSIVVRAPTGETMLVDAGNSSREAGEIVLPYLRQRGIERLDVVVLTHPHQDHVGGLPLVFERLPVGRFLDSAQRTTNQAYQRTLELAIDLGIPSERARFPHTTLDLGPEVAVQVLAPQEPLLEIGQSVLNNNSVVVHLHYGEMAVLLTGDLEQEGEERLLANRVDLRSQVLHVPHHGSATSSTEAFLGAVGPEVALISAGAGNQYGHPDAQTLERLTERGVSIYRTDQHGTLTVYISPTSYQVETER